MRILRLEGTHREMGEAFGETCRDDIATFYRLRLDIAIEQAWTYGGRRVSEDEVLDLARRSLPLTQAYHPDGYEELMGIADGANLKPAEILTLNGLTDFRDGLAWEDEEAETDGCSAFIAQRNTSKDNVVLCGQTWDLATNNMPFVIGIHRKPKRGAETWAMTTVGCLTLIGMNEHGLSVGTTNVRTLDARPGVNYLSILHKLLTYPDVPSAVGAVTSAPRAGGHYYFLADAAGRATAVECTATLHRQQEIHEGIHVHCNHCVVDAHQDLEGREPTSSSLSRTERLQTLLENGTGNIDLDYTQQCLSDTANGDDAICRDDTNGISSNGAVVMSPERREIRMCHGLPSTAKWVTMHGPSEPA